jgi:diaminopimelate dehydrogenase
MTDKIDVMILCGGSSTDLPKQTPFLAEYFNVVDNFDTHAKIPEHFRNVDEKAKKGEKNAKGSYRVALFFEKQIKFFSVS